MLSAPVLRADEFNKMTYLTFSGPVQVPGVVLPAGTYMFKLADPDSGRRVIQVWDKEGTKLYTTLLTIPDQMMEAKDDPVVLFTETPSGEPQAVKSWFYTGERNGYEFVYPKDQAMKIAQATHGSVLAQTGTSSSTDIASMSKASVGRIDATGTVAENNGARSDNSTTARNDTAATTTQAQATTADAPSQSASASTTATTTAPSQSASASTTAQSQPATPPASASQPSANRTDAASSRPAAPATSAAAPAPKTNDGQRTVGTAGRLPQTASNAPLIQLMAGLSLLAAIGVHQLRKRQAAHRA
jgi:hypothetical protein